MNFYISDADCWANDPWLNAVGRMGGTTLCTSKAFYRMRPIAFRCCYGMWAEELKMIGKQMKWRAYSATDRYGKLSKKETYIF